MSGNHAPPSSVIPSRRYLRPSARGIQTLSAGRWPRRHPGCRPEPL